MKTTAIALICTCLILSLTSVQTHAEDTPNVQLSIWTNGTETVAKTYYYLKDGTQCENPLCKGVVLVIIIYLKNGEVVRIEEYDLSE